MLMKIILILLKKEIIKNDYFLFSYNNIKLIKNYILYLYLI